MAERYVNIDRAGTMYVGDLILERQVGLSGLLTRESVATVTGGRRATNEIYSFAELSVDSTESSGTNRSLQQWNPNLTKDDISGF